MQICYVLKAVPEAVVSISVNRCFSKRLKGKSSPPQVSKYQYTSLDQDQTPRTPANPLLSHYNAGEFLSCSHVDVVLMNAILSTNISNGGEHYIRLPIEKNLQYPTIWAPGTTHCLGCPEPYSARDYSPARAKVVQGPPGLSQTMRKVSWLLICGCCYFYPKPSRSIQGWISRIS